MPCCGARALAKAIEMSDGEAVRKKEKLQELVEQKERAQHQTGEIISSKAELDTIYDVARKSAAASYPLTFGCESAPRCFGLMLTFAQAPRPC